MKKVSHFFVFKKKKKFSVKRQKKKKKKTHFFVGSGHLLKKKMDIPWVVWLILVLVILLIVAVIVLFIIKPNKKSTGNTGPQGFQGDLGRQGPGQGATGPQGSIGPLGPAGDRGFQGASGAGQPTSSSVQSMTVRPGQSIILAGSVSSLNFPGVVTRIGNVVTFTFSDVRVFVADNTAFLFTMFLTMPTGIVLPLNAAQSFTGQANSFRDSRASPYNLLITDVSNTTSDTLVITWTCMTGLLWNGAGGPVPYDLSFSITVNAAP